MDKRRKKNKRIKLILKKGLPTKGISWKQSSLYRALYAMSKRKKAPLSSGLTSLNTSTYQIKYLAIKAQMKGAPSSGLAERKQLAIKAQMKGAPSSSGLVTRRCIYCGAKFYEDVSK